MIAKDEYLRKICSNYEQVENYEKAISDKENKWHIHHRREIDEMKSRQQLIDEGKYYDVEPKELIFLTKEEHCKLHLENALPETRKKMSEYAKLRVGENNGMFKKQHSENSRKKISEAAKLRTGEKSSMFGKHHSEESKKKMSEAKKGDKHPQFGWHWWNNGKICKIAKEQPGQDFVRGRLKHNK